MTAIALTRQRDAIVLRKFRGVLTAMRRSAHAIGGPQPTTKSALGALLSFALLFLAVLLIIGLLLLVWPHSAHAATLSPLAGVGMVGSIADIEAEIGKMTKGVESFKAEHLRRVDEIEARLNRQEIGLGGDDSSPVARRPKLARPGALKAFQDFLRGGDPAAMTEFVRPEAAGQTQVGPNTGYLVPQEIVLELEKLQRDYSPMRRVARLYEARSDLIDFLVKDRSATSGWVGEQAARTETPGDQLDKVSIPLGELYANVAVSQRMLDDTADLAGQYTIETIADQFSQQEGAAFSAGTGINRPRGFLTYPVATTVDATRAFGTLQYRPTGAAGAFVAAPNGGDCLVNLVADLRGGYRQGRGVAWLMNSATQAQVRLLKDSQGRPLYVAGLIENEPDRLLGYPVEIDENMPAIAANSFSIAFGNWLRGYVICDHFVGLRILRDPFTNKPNTMFYGTRRVGGAVLNSDCIKLLKFSVT